MKKANALGTTITGVTADEAWSLLDSLISGEPGRYVCFCEGHLNVQGMKDKAVREPVGIKKIE